MQGYKRLGWGLGFKVATDWDEGLGSGIRGLRLGFRVEGSGSPAPN